MERKPQPSWGPTVAKFFVVPQRLLLAFMGCCAVITAYTNRSVLNIAINKIVIPPHHKNHTESAICPLAEDNAVQNNDTSHLYDWDETMQGVILGSFYFGSLITHLPGGVLADAYGAKYVLLVGQLVSGIATMLTPIIIRELGPYALIVTRVIIGFGQGILFPCLGVLVSHWAPAQERTLFAAFVLGGGQLGTIICNALSGWLLSHFHWEISFYVFGIGILLWCVFFQLICYSSPHNHPFIKDAEYTFVIENVANITNRDELPPVPFKMIFKSIPVWAMIIGQQGHDWGFYMLFTDLPKYFNEVLQMKIHKTGIFAALPSLSMWITTIVAAAVNDYLITKKGVSRTISRRVNGFIAAVPPAVLMIAASYAGCNHELALAFFVLSMATMAFFYSSIKQGSLDMGPNYAGTVMAMSNGLGCITGLVVPIIAGAMTHHSTLKEWRSVFWLTLAFKTVCGVFYCWKASADVQPYNSPPPKEE